MNICDYQMLLNEIKETTNLIEDNIDNKYMIKYLTGKLNLLVQSLVDVFNSN